MNSMVSQSYASARAGMVLKRSFLAFIVILFFCNIAIYLSLAVSARLEPQYWIGLLVVFGVALAWISPRTRWEAFRSPLFLWCTFFIGLTVILFVVVPGSHAEQLKERIRTVVLLMALLGVFLMLSHEVQFLKKLVLLAVILGVVLNLVGFVHNGFLRPSGAIWGHQPAGFYINPNESGIALVLGLLLSVDVLRTRWRPMYAVLVLAGTSVTFSREAELGWLVAVVTLCVLGMLSWKSLVVWLLVLGACSGAFILLIVKTHLIPQSLLHYYYHSGVYKFTRFIGGAGMGESDILRLRLAEMGWSIFLAHPWIGNGIGAAYHWSLPASTHSMYLLYMDEYGVIGFFLYPLLIWCMIRKSVGEIRKLAWAMAIFLAFWGLFDHNIVQNYYSLFAISLTAAMSRISAGGNARQAVPASVEVQSG